jgi:hypothetical protein
LLCQLRDSGSLVKQPRYLWPARILIRQSGQFGADPVDVIVKLTGTFSRFTNPATCSALAFALRLDRPLLLRRRWVGREQIAKPQTHGFQNAGDAAPGKTRNQDTSLPSFRDAERRAFVPVTWTFRHPSACADGSSVKQLGEARGGHLASL